MVTSAGIFLIPDPVTCANFRDTWKEIRRRMGRRAKPARPTMDAALAEWCDFWFSADEVERDCATEDVLMTAYFILAEACGGLIDPGRHVDCILPEYRPGLLLLLAFGDAEAATVFAGDALVDFDAGPFSCETPPTWQEQFGRMLDKVARKRIPQFLLTWTDPSHQVPPPWRWPGGRRPAAQ